MNESEKFQDGYLWAVREMRFNRMSLVDLYAKCEGVDHDFDRGAMEAIRNVGFRIEIVLNLNKPSAQSVETKSS